MNTPKKPHGEHGVNMEGTTATLSLLSEGRIYCDKCKGQIDGLAVYIIRPNGCAGFDFVAVLHPDCYGGEAS